MDAILLGGGLGKRFAGQTPKQFQLLGNVPVFIHALKALLSMECFRQVVLVFPKAHLDLAREQLDLYLPDTGKTSVRIVAGGERRQDSSYLALEAIEETNPLPSRVLIHDACRPYLSADFLIRVKDSLFERAYGAWVPVVPVVETLKRVENSQVVETVDRSLVQRVQTPQVFEYTVIRSLMEKVKDVADLSFTDDASLCEHYGIPVGTFEGDVRNIKLTYDFELETVRLMMDQHKLEEPACAPESGTTYTV
jgi:2-C-methyl-D-erythritol 4-phosphate cytidylyltransferase/2-C-methyl-D-erythritol 2,4-cyclodiphosphate synthase